MTESEKDAQRLLLAACCRKVGRYSEGIGPALGAWPLVAREAGLDIGRDGEPTGTGLHGRQHLSQAWRGARRLSAPKVALLESFVEVKKDP